MPDYEKAAELLIEKCDKLRARIEELEKAMQDVCDLISNEGKVNKWQIQNWLAQALKGK